MAYKQKSGSPFQRNFGVGKSPAKQTSPMKDTQEKSGFKMKSSPFNRNGDSPLEMQSPFLAEEGDIEAYDRATSGITADMTKGELRQYVIDNNANKRGGDPGRIDQSSAIGLWRAMGGGKTEETTDPVVEEEVEPITEEVVEEDEYSDYGTQRDEYSTDLTDEQIAHNKKIAAENNLEYSGGTFSLHGDVVSADALKNLGMINIDPKKSYDKEQTKRLYEKSYQEFLDKAKNIAYSVDGDLDNLDQIIKDQMKKEHPQNQKMFTTKLDEEGKWIEDESDFGEEI